MTDGQHELEQAVLACMMISPRVAEKVVDTLDSTDFTHNVYAIIYSTMRHMMDDGDHIDELTLPAELRKDGHGDEACAVVNRLYGVASSVPSAEAGIEYAKAVREEAVRRNLVREVDAQIGYSGDIEDMIGGVEAAVFAARTRLDGKGVLRELSGTSLLSPLEAFLSAPQGVGGYPYPLPAMRRLYGDYEPGRLTYLAGGSGDGKTTMLFQWVEELCAAGAKVCVYELEMTELQVSRLLVMQGAGLTPRQAKGIDPLSMEDQARYDARKAEVAGWDLTVKCGPVTPMQIRGDQTRERYDVIAVDHMSKFARTSAGEYADLTLYSSQLHRITRDLSCSVICLLQLKAARSDSSGRVMVKEPTTADIRGGRMMEEDADDVLLMWNDRDTAGRRTGTGLLIVGKMRDGEPDKAIPLRFDGMRIKFLERDVRPSGPSVLSKRKEAFDGQL